MTKRPYFSVSRASFEKNAGYKSTVHALAELVDNAVEANASNVVIALMVDLEQRLKSIAVIDDGDGMSPARLQEAVCEKAGTHLDRIRGDGSPSRRKLGKYGVGLPKASISQCNVLTAWSWEKSGPKNASRNGIDITDQAWIDKGAIVDESEKEEAPATWLKAAKLETAKHGTLIVWEDLEGVTWGRARWGSREGLIPNLQFEIGRVYRKMIAPPKPELTVTVVVVDTHFRKLETIVVEPNDPLYLQKGAPVWREKLDDGTSWPPDDPLFDAHEPSIDPTMTIAISLGGREEKRLTVKWRASTARRQVFALLGKRNAGDMPHGKHAAKNIGLSLLREGREISMSAALSNPSEPRERWFGVEVDFPHELDAILGMTNNKQEYTRFERVLKADAAEFMLENESSPKCLDRIAKEDAALAICLRIAWRTQDIWRDTKAAHMRLREETLWKKGDKGNADDDDDESSDDGTTVDDSPEGAAEGAATRVDPPKSRPRTAAERKKLQEQLKKELLDAGVPRSEAEQLAARVVERGLTYAFLSRPGLGSPFFNVSMLKGVKLIEVNEDHPIHPYIKGSIQGDDAEDLQARLKNSRIATLLMLEAWAAIEAGTLKQEEKRKLHQVREDWGRKLEAFVTQFAEDEKSAGTGTGDKDDDDEDAA